MGSSIGPVMTTNIMNELENEIIKLIIKLMNNGRIKFYCQLVADTLLVVSLQGVNHKHNLLSSFDSNSRFTIKFLKNEVLYICDFTR